MRVGLIAVAITAALTVAAPASAAKYTYAGDVGDRGKVAFDVSIKRGHVVKMTQIRMFDVPMTCAISGDIHGDLNVNGAMKVADNGKFAVSAPQPDHGNITTVNGKFKRGTVKGQLDLSYHYDAQAGPPAYPEEDCSSGPLKFKATIGAPDGTQAGGKRS